jgi:flagellar motor switch protein FliN/FliY
MTDDDDPPGSVFTDPTTTDAPRRAAAVDRAPVFRQLPRQPEPPVRAPRLETLRDLELSVRVELGRARLSIEELLRLGDGSVVALDRHADDPVDVYVSDRLVARGEVVVVRGKLGVRLTEVVSPVEDD